LQVRDRKGVTDNASSQKESSKEARKEKEIVLLHLHTHDLGLEEKFSSLLFQPFQNDNPQFSFP